MNPSKKKRMEYYEFFAGAGMARLGLGENWRCVFANDISEQKGASYRANFDKAPELKIGDISNLKLDDLPGQADLAWASFPCQDLSLAGNGAGLKGARSGLFWEFWKLIQALRAQGRAPQTIILENVYGTVTSHKGRDMAAICTALANGGYRFAPVVIDASLFVPQSRPRLFILAFHEGINPPADITCLGPEAPWHPEAFGTPYDLLEEEARRAWIWLSPPLPSPRSKRLGDIIEEKPTGVRWHTPFETHRLLSMMTPINRDKVRAAELMGTRVVGTIYKRTRPDECGIKRQRAEVRFDDVAGCLRTPAGGSSRQIILVVEGKSVRSRLISPREAARLMGIPEDYSLPERYNEAYHLVGDGVAVPVVAYLKVNFVEPALRKALRRSVTAA